MPMRHNYCVFDMKRIAVRAAVGHYCMANPHVVGSVPHGADREGSDIDVLADIAAWCDAVRPGRSVGRGGIAVRPARRSADSRRPVAEVLRQSARAGATGISERRLPDCLDHMRAVTDACSLTEGLAMDDFLEKSALSKPSSSRWDQG